MIFKDVASRSRSLLHNPGSIYMKSLETSTKKEWLHMGVPLFLNTSYLLIFALFVKRITLQVNGSFIILLEGEQRIYA